LEIVSGETPGMAGTLHGTIDKGVYCIAKFTGECFRSLLGTLKENKERQKESGSFARS
jgi:hypothetical protein